MIKVTASHITRAFPIMPRRMTFWEHIFQSIDKKEKTLFHYDFVMEVENAMELSRHDIVMLRKGIKVIITSVEKSIVKCMTYQKVEPIKDGELNGHAVVIARRG